MTTPTGHVPYPAGAPGTAAANHLIPTQREAWVECDDPDEPGGRRRVSAGRPSPATPTTKEKR